MVCKTAHCKKVHVKGHCRQPPEGRGMGPVAHAQARGRELANNARKRETGAWHKGIAKDRIDRRALTDKTLTKRENAKLLRDLPKQYR
jgi:hypothetical protein